MVARGRAVVVKKTAYEDVWVNEAGDQVSPPSSPEREKEHRPKRQPLQKLSSDAAPVEARQASEGLKQSVRREALVHRFDHHNDIQDPDKPAASVEPIANLPSFASLQSIQASPGQGLSDDNTQAEELPIDVHHECHTTTTATSHVTLTQPELHFSSSQSSERSNTSTGNTSTGNRSHHSNDEMASANNFIPTNQHRNMRACMVCSIVRTTTQFKNTGCPNCEGFLMLRGNDEGIQECTSMVFEGLITVSDTTKSWVARWQRLEGYVPGVYAVQVEGILPEEMIAAAEENGIHYIPRDGSVNEALPTDA